MHGEKCKATVKNEEVTFLKEKLKEGMKNACGLAGAVFQLLLFLTVLVGVCVLVSCAVMQLNQKSIAEILNENWALSPALPSDVRCEYEYPDPRRIISSSKHYYVFDWEGQDDSVFSTFHVEKSAEFEEACEGMLLEYASGLGESISDDYRPDWSEPYRWQYKWRSGSEGEIMDAPIFGYDDVDKLSKEDGRVLYMVYFPAAERLCVVTVYL